MIVELLFIFVNVAYSQQFVSIINQDGIFWFQHQNNRFLTLGVNHVNNGGPDDGVGGRETPACKATYPLCGDTLSFAPALGYSPYFNSTQARYGSSSEWVTSTATRLKSWGFNSVGGWSAKIVETESGLYYAHLLDMLTTWQNHDNLPDIFGTDFEQRSYQIAEAECLSRNQDVMLLGYQTDNELPWYQDFVAQYLTNTNNSTYEGYKQILNFLETRYDNDIQKLNSAWNIQAKTFPDVAKHLGDKSLNKTSYDVDKNDFLFIVATKYFQVTTLAIRKYDTNHLILGCRADVLPDPVLLALIPYVDVVDVHSYTDDCPTARLQHTNAMTKKPVMLGEFSFTAVDSNLPNTKGARSGHPFATQSQRAAAYFNYVKPLIELPFIVGYHWWQWADEPSTGRWPDGEDSNYGLVHIDDDEYSILTDTMKSANEQANKWHESSLIKSDQEI